MGHRGSDSTHADSPPRELQDALARVRPRLGRLASTLLFFPTIGSTNDVASAHATGDRGDAEGLVVVADAQTAGRGRRGHVWFSPPGSGLYVSVVLSPARASADRDRAVQLLTLSVGVALAEAIETVAGPSTAPGASLRAELKWPNDLYVERRKLAGILAEAISTSGPAASHARHVVVGYGINVAPTAYPPELRDRATSLESELGRPIDRHQLLAETLAALASRYDDLLAGRFDAILDAWRRRAPRSSGARVEWSDRSGRRSGVTAGIDRDGALLVRTGSAVERIVGGELTWL